MFVVQYRTTWFAFGPYR